MYPYGSTRRCDTTAGNGGPNVESSFDFFFEAWLVRQEHYLDELLSVSPRHCSHDNDLCDLINRVLFHYQQYYEEKSRIAHADIFLVFSPTWFTHLERTFLWIAGFRPTLTFRLIADSIHDMTEDQSRLMSRLVVETKAKEKALNDELARVQESVGAPPLFEVIRRRLCARDGGIIGGGDDGVLGSLKRTLEVVVANADTLRKATAEKVVEILSPAQSVKFLAAVTQLQLEIRSLGLQMQRERDAATYTY